VGSAARLVLGLWIPSTSAGLPWAILIVNLAGSLFLGFYLARRERAISRRGSLQFWAIGVFGSFTTFSAFSVNLVEILAAGRTGVAASYLAGSLLGGLICAFAGLRIGGLIR